MTGPTTLLEGGRAAHSALKSSLNIHSNETPTCNISKNSAMTKILQQCNLIVWDECSMGHKKNVVVLSILILHYNMYYSEVKIIHIIVQNNTYKKKSLEALDRTMKDPRSTPVDEINACLTFDRF